MEAGVAVDSVEYISPGVNVVGNPPAVTDRGALNVDTAEGEVHGPACLV
jgi:hypothetical protein